MTLPTMVELPGLPPLTWAQYSWEASDVLPSWRGFQARYGAYGGRTGGVSDGRVQLTIATRLNRHALPHDAQIAAWRWLRDHEAKVSAAVWAAAFADYPYNRREWLRHYPDEEEQLPELSSPDGLVAVMGLHDVHILANARDGFAYLGFEIGCNWEVEHGFGVLTHKDRIIAVGDATTSIRPTAAIDDDGGADL